MITFSGVIGGGKSVKSIISGSRYKLPPPTSNPKLAVSSWSLFHNS